MSYASILTVTAFLWLAINSVLLVYLLIDRKKGFDPRVVGLIKRFSELEIAYSDLQDLYERLLLSHKRLRSSAGMAKLRGMKEQDKSEDLAKASEAEILRRMNLNRRPA